MAEYVWQNDLGEGAEVDRLRLMSTILDPSSRGHLAALPVQADWQCLEIGAGNGSLSQCLAMVDAVRPGGVAVRAGARLPSDSHGRARESGAVLARPDLGARHGVDYHVCRTVAPRLQELVCERHMTLVMGPDL